MNKQLELKCDACSLDGMEIDFTSTSPVPLEIRIYDGENSSQVNLSKVKMKELYEFLHQALEE